jgi:hypothetical protein
MNRIYKQNYHATEYPEIYEQTYWGNFEYNPNHFTSTQEIINNRNKFIKDYCIEKIVLIKPQFIREMVNRSKRKYLDHVECYKKSSGEYVLVSSPYTERYDKEHIDDGWAKIYPMYSNITGDPTFIKIINLI